ncbi:MAG: hypothetical protein GY858_09670 [Candidatus Omnitrophica bacterium]|nr:hypothetical protein [Candidatus Omnitrophota bacterium]
MSNKTLKITIGSINVSIETNNQRYFDYLSWYFKGSPASIDTPTPVDIKINWVKKLKSKNLALRIGSNTYQDKNALEITRKIAKKEKVLFNAVLEKNKLILNINVKRKREDILRYRFAPEKINSLFFELTFPFLYYPAFWYAQYFLNQHLLHASAVECNGKGIIICGLEGIGKTSLGLGLLDDNAKFLSDNLVFYDENDIYSCYECVRLNKNTETVPWQNKFKKINRGKNLKDFYLPTENFNIKKTKPTIFLFPYFSKQYETKEIDAKWAANYAILLSHLPSELNNYSQFRNSYNLFDLNSNLPLNAQVTLEKLLAKTRNFMVGMPKQDGLEKNITRVKELISHV